MSNKTLRKLQYGLNCGGKLSVTKIQAMINLTYISPFFIVADLKISISFYVDMLGFAVRFIGPDDDPYWCIVGRDNISIMLKAITPDVKPIPNHTRHP